MTVVFRRNNLAMTIYFPIKVLIRNGQNFYKQVELVLRQSENEFG